MGAVEIEVKVPDLKKLPDGSSNYEKVGGTDEHHGPPSHPSEDNNHWGAPDVIDALDTIAAKAKTKFSLTNVLRYNDISLGVDAENKGYGGRFDVNGNWTGSHAEHREGKDVDVRKNPPRADGLDESLLDPFAYDVVIDVYPSAVVTIHGPIEHFHIDFD